MKTIELSNGDKAFVDDEDLERLSKHHWWAQSRRKGKSVARAKIGDKCILMHRFIMNAQEGQIIDHIDGNPLNNQKANLRFCTTSQNLMNRGINNTNTTGYKGVSWAKGLKKYMACIRVKGKNKHLGYFSDAIEAAKVYDKAILEHHGEFAWLNFSKEEPHDS